MSDLRVLIVADDPLARAGLAALLSAQPGCVVVGQAGEEGELASALDVYRPQVVAWDLGWERAPAARLERLAALAEAGVPLVALLPDESQAVEAYTAGARGLLPRDTGPERLVAALLAAAQGLAVLDPALAAPVLGSRDPVPALVEALTPRELEVLQLLAEGLPNKVIAHRLDISEHTVKFHVNAVMGKLGAQSRTEAVVRATRQGLILL
jgi:DNA-binding NarL/FixJ family response regulator